MLFGKLFTGLAFAFMAIAPVACAPTAEPEFSVVEKRTSIGDYTRDCHTKVQTHCDNIHKCIQGNNGVVDVTVTATIIVEINAILAIIVDLLAEIKVVTFVQADFEDCVPVFNLIVQLLTSILIEISSSCTAEAIAVLASVVLSLNVHINLCSNFLLTGITTFASGLVGLVLGVIGNILAGLSGDLKTCIVAFASACSPFGA